MRNASITRRSFLVAMAAAATASGQGLAPARQYRIGVIANHVPVKHLELGAASPFRGSAEFVMGLRELGWEDGRNIRLIWRSAEGRADMRNLLGGKGANLAEMSALGLPVPSAEPGKAERDEPEADGSAPG